MAALLGIDVDRTISLTFVIGAALAAVAGVMSPAVLRRDRLLHRLPRRHQGVHRRGARRHRLAARRDARRLLIGLIEAFWSAYFSAEYKDVAAFSILILVLIFLPTGCSAGPKSRRSDRSRHLVLIYVMLGWGLNIVVGLAGLLDLGYVAFYAVGAYSYALLATHLRLSLLDLPAARRHPRGLLGHPARLPGAAAARRLSRHRHARLRRDHPHRAAQLGSFTGGPNGISGIPRPTFFGLPFNTAERSRPSPASSGSSFSRCTA
jgi:ABC-type branched-subunit amino acid transport system permease subunit